MKTNKCEISIDMGDKRSSNDSILRWETERIASETAFKMADYLFELNLCSQLLEIFSERRLKLLFAKYFKERIFPSISEFTILMWYKRRGVDISYRVVEVPRFPWYPLIKWSWPDSDVPIVPNSRRSYMTSVNRIRKGLKRLLVLYCGLPYNFDFRLNRIGTFKDIFGSIIGKKRSKAFDGEVQGNEGNSRIGIDFIEGIDLKKRCDLFWWPDSRISPKNIVIYFDGVSQEPVTDEILSAIEDMGMTWVCLVRGCVPCRDDHFWTPSKKEPLVDFINNRNKSAQSSPLGKWISRFSKSLLNQVGYWQAFFEEFDIKIHLDIKESGIENISKNLAMDLAGGICIGKERSSLRNEPLGNAMGLYPCHIFLAWNKDSAKTIEMNENGNEYSLICGNMNDYSFQSDKRGNRLSGSLKGHVKLTIGLFDNVATDNRGVKKRQGVFVEHMKAFYLKFLSWVIEDNEVALIIKSKKPVALERLDEVNALLEKAKSTGRCLLYTNEPGVLSSDLSSAIDIAVTIGLILPATFIEMALCGCRVIHYDATNIRPFENELYNWGYEKVIFDDIDRMMAAFKKYKDNPSIETGFGDFSGHINEVDPFNDGRAGERSGSYMRWVLESYEEGKGRQEAVMDANRKYVEKWGEDKILVTKHAGFVKTGNRMEG